MRSLDLQSLPPPSPHHPTLRPTVHQAEHPQGVQTWGQSVLRQVLGKQKDLLLLLTGLCNGESRNPDGLWQKI